MPADQPDIFDQSNLPTCGNLGAISKRWEHHSGGSCCFCSGTARPPGGTVLIVEGQGLSVRFCRTCLRALGFMKPLKIGLHDALRELFECVQKMPFEKVAAYFAENEIEQIAKSENREYGPEETCWQLATDLHYGDKTIKEEDGEWFLK